MYKVTFKSMETLKYRFVKVKINLLYLERKSHHPQLVFTQVPLYTKRIRIWKFFQEGGKLDYPEARTNNKLEPKTHWRRRALRHCAIPAHHKQQLKEEKNKRNGTRIVTIETEYKQYTLKFSRCAICDRETFYKFCLEPITNHSKVFIKTGD